MHCFIVYNNNQYFIDTFDLNMPDCAKWLMIGTASKVLRSALENRNKKKEASRQRTRQFFWPDFTILFMHIS